LITTKSKKFESFGFLNKRFELKNKKNEGNDARSSITTYLGTYVDVLNKEKKKANELL